MLLLRLVVEVLSVGIMILGASVVSGQDYPSKPIRIVTAPPGGSSDFTARQIAQGIAGPLGQSVIVDNRPSLLAAEFVSKAPPDGYTLLVSGGALWLTPLLQKVPYDVERDFSSVSLLLTEVNIFVVHPSLPVKSIKELIALAKSKPGELNYASAVTGGPQHINAELFKSMAGVNIVRISYKSGALLGVLAGEAHMTIDGGSQLMPHIKSGKLRALAITSARSSVLFPGLPTIAESGVPGYEMVGMTVILATGKTPGPIINRLNQEIVRVVNLPETKERFLNAGVETVGSSPEELAIKIKSEISKIGKVIKEAGIKAD